MFPGLGRIHVAPFSDEALYGELQGKAAFWLQPDFYGVDISCLHAAALRDYFSQATRGDDGVLRQGFAVWVHQASVPTCLHAAALGDYFSQATHRDWFLVFNEGIAQGARNLRY